MAKHKPSGRPGNKRKHRPGLVARRRRKQNRREGMRDRSSPFDKPVCVMRTGTTRTTLTEDGEPRVKVHTWVDKIMWGRRPKGDADTQMLRGRHGQRPKALRARRN